MVKKSFKIKSELTQALDDTVNAAKHHAGELYVEIMPIRKILLDLDNPRNLALTFQDLFSDITKKDEQYERKKKEKESLQSMAKSIGEQGIINPIVVYKLGENYQLIAGERRTLASIMAKKEEVPAKILTDKPDSLKLSLLQWAENVEREDLTLWERLCNLEKIFNAYAYRQNKKLIQVTLNEIKTLIGCSLQQGANYKCLAESSHKLKQLIQTGKITNIEKAALIAKSDIDKQDLLIAACLKGSTLKELKKIVNKAITIIEKSTNSRRGRQYTRVNFGTTKNTVIAKIIIPPIISTMPVIL